IARHRRRARLGDDRHRHPQGLRLQRHREVEPRHPEGLRPLRAQLGLRVVAAAVRRRALRASAARHAEPRSFVPAADRHGHGPDVPTPVADGTYIYTVNDRGIMFCLDAKTGKEIYSRQRLRPATYSGSPVLADGKIYITNEDGLTSVIKAGPVFQVLAENDVD